MLQAFESQKKKTDMMITKERKEYKELCQQRNQLNQDLDSKMNLLKQKTEKMSELIGKIQYFKLSQKRLNKYSDPNTQELLHKWEISNMKMKENYETEIENMQQKELPQLPKKEKIPKSNLKKEKVLSNKSLSKHSNNEIVSRSEASHKEIDKQKNEEE